MTTYPMIRGGFHAALACLWLAIGLAALTRPSMAAPEGRQCESEPTDMLIEYGDLVRCTIDRLGDVDVFRFVGGSGDIALLRITRLGEEFSCFQLFDPDGLLIGGFSCGNFVDYLLTQTGTYTVLAQGAVDQHGEYALVLERIDPTPPAAVPIEYNQIIDDQIAAEGDVDAFFFAGQAGDTVTIQIFRRDDNFACFEVFGPDRMFLDGISCGAGEYLLTTTGRHAILVSATIDGTADYTLTLICLDGACEDGGVRPLAASGCLTVHDAPVVGQRIRLTQPDEAPQTTDTDIRGCFSFDVVQGKPFDVMVVGDEVAEVTTAR